MTQRQDIPTAGSPQSWAWSGALAIVAFGGTLATACMMPFVGLTTILAITARPAQAVIAMTAMWAGNQLLGFGLLGYPFTAYAFMWGAALLGASLAALFVARIGSRVDAASGPAQLGIRFLAAFVAFEGLLFVFAHFAGGLETFTPAIVVRIGLNDAIWFVLLIGLHLVLTRAAPRWFGTVPIVRIGA